EQRQRHEEHRLRRGRIHGRRVKKTRTSVFAHYLDLPDFTIAHTIAMMPNTVRPPTTSNIVFVDPIRRLPRSPTASPVYSSIGAHTIADVTLATQNRLRRIRMMPAASGMTARTGPKKR